MSLDTQALQEELDDLESREGDEDDPLDTEETDRLGKLRMLESELDGKIEDADIIAEDDFEDHARQLAEDVAGSEAFKAWPFTCIDWEQAANELQQDYSCITFDGEDYYTRG